MPVPTPNYAERNMSGGGVNLSESKWVSTEYNEATWMILNNNFPCRGRVPGSVNPRNR